MKHVILFGLVGLVSGGGCTAAAPELSESDISAIRARFDAVAQHVSAEDNAAWARDFTEDAVFMFANTPALHGRAEIQAWGEADPVVTSLTFDNLQIHGGGDLAWATSNYSLTIQGVSEPDRGKQLVVIRRQPDGSWLTVAASVSTDLPPQPATAAQSLVPDR